MVLKEFPDVARSLRLGALSVSGTFCLVIGLFYSKNRWDSRIARVPLAEARAPAKVSG